jgi:Icc-related predicted phosphoesterase
MDEAHPFRVAAVGDVHVTEQDLGALPAIVSEAARVADALVLAGDLTDHGRTAEAEMVARVVRSATLPVIAVLGNHDHECGEVEAVSAVLRDAGVRLLDGDATLVGDVGFVGVKGFAGGFGRRMLGSFGEPAIKAFVTEGVEEALKLENAMRKVKARRTMVILHYAPVADTVEGEPLEIYPFLGSSRLGETIDRFEVDAVVHGHALRGRYLGRTPGGTPVYNVAAHIEKPSGHPFALIEL